MSLGTERLRNGPAFGTFQTLPSTVVAEGLGRMGYDFVIVDLQHGSAGWEGLLEIIMGIEKGGALPIVRVGWNDPMQIMRALDLGAVGVVVPMVSSAEEAERAVSATRYAPEGTRSIGPIRHHCVPEGHVYSPEAMNREILCFPMIESAEALGNIEAIAAVPGIAGLFFGPFDMALSLGLDLAPFAPEVDTALDRTVALCETNGIVAATVALSVDGAEALYARGVRMVALGSDLAMITAGARKEAAEAGRLKRAFRAVR
jgi:4-hydroxy-2-oxoheptanedioate aldolase